MNRMVLGASGALIAIGAAWVVAQETLPPSGKPQTPASAEATVADQYSYAIGLEMGTSFRSSETPLNVENVLAGLQDGLSGGEPKFAPETCFKAMQQLQSMMRDKAMAQQKTAGSKNRQLGEAFLAKNKAAEGVQVTKSGLQYKVITPGTGVTPARSDTVRCNYRGTLIDGTEFDASAKHGGPATFPVGQVIAGWTEALQMMKVGGKWELFIPADLAYGDDQRGPIITPGSTLVFEIELLGIEGK